jgi:antitoxin (DNA-binding transcriptional repressor) of toxin-antitoxin stability system
VNYTEIAVTDLRRDVGTLTGRLKAGEVFKVTSYYRPLALMVPWEHADRLLKAERDLGRCMNRWEDVADRVRAAAALHVPHPEDGECSVCLVPLPCATLRALGKIPEPEGEPSEPPTP